MGLEMISIMWGEGEGNLLPALPLIKTQACLRETPPNMIDTIGCIKTSHNNSDPFRYNKSPEKIINLEIVIESTWVFCQLQNSLLPK